MDCWGVMCSTVGMRPSPSTRCVDGAVRPFVVLALLMLAVPLRAAESDAGLPVEVTSSKGRAS